MRPLLITLAAASALVAGVAIAQPAPGPDGGAPPPAREMGERGPGGPGGWMRRMMMRRPPPTKAAFFNFRRGDAAVTIKCADDEPMKACTDAATTMLQALKDAAPK